MAKLELPHDPVLASKVIDQKNRLHEGGIIGRLLGLGSEKPGNIAALVILVSFMMFAYVLVYAPDSQSLSKKTHLA